MSWWPWRRRVPGDDGIGDGLHPPGGIELRDDAGQWWPVQAVYSHTDDRGLQVYDVVDAPDTVVVEARADTLPGMTALRVPGYTISPGLEQEG